VFVVLFLSPSLSLPCSPDCMLQGAWCSWPFSTPSRGESYFVCLLCLFFVLKTILGEREERESTPNTPAKRSPNRHAATFGVGHVSYITLRLYAVRGRNAPRIRGVVDPHLGITLSSLLFSSLLSPASLSPPTCMSNLKQWCSPTTPCRRPEGLVVCATS